MPKIAELTIEITNNANRAKISLDRLTGALQRVQEAKNSLNFGNIQTGGLQSLYKYVHSLTRILEPLTYRCYIISEAFDKMGATSAASLVRVSAQAEKLNAKMSQTSTTAGNASKSLEKNANAAGKISKKTKDAADGADKLAKANKRLGESAKSASSGLASLIKQFGRLLKLKIMRQIVRNIMEGFREGVGNLYEYSRALGSIDSTNFKNTMDAYSTALLKMKNSVAAAVAPLLQQLLPVVQTLVNWFVLACNVLNQFISLLQGKTTFTKATDYFVEFGEAADGATGKVKELQRTILGFDEINKLNDSGSGSGGGASAATPDYSQMFEEADIDLSNWQGVKRIFDDIKEIIDEIVKGVKDIANRVANWAINTDFEPLLESIHGLLQSIKGIIEPLFEVIGTVWDTLIAPLLTAIVEDYLPRLINALTPIVDGVGTFLEGLNQVLEPILQFLEPIFEIVFEISTVIAEIVGSTIGDLLGTIGETLSEIAPDLEAASEELAPLLEDIKELVKEVGEKLKKAVEDVLQVLKDIWNSDLMKAIRNLVIKSSIDGIRLALELVRDVLVVISALLDGDMSTAIKKVGNLFINLTKNVLKLCKTIVNGALDVLIEMGKIGIKIKNDIVAPIYNWAIDCIYKGYDIMIDVWYSVIEWLSQKWNGFIDFINNTSIAKLLGIQFEHVQYDFSDTAEDVKARWKETTDSWKMDTDDFTNEFTDGVTQWKTDFNDSIDNQISKMREYNSVWDEACDGNWENAKDMYEQIEKKYSETEAHVGKAFEVNIDTSSASSSLWNLYNGWNGTTIRFNAAVTGTSQLSNGMYISMQPYANGGVPDYGSVFIAGESGAGAEMVGNINGRTGVVSQGEISGIRASVEQSGAREAQLLSEQNALLRELIAKPNVADVNVSSILNGVSRANRRAGRALVAMES